MKIQPMNVLASVSLALALSACGSSRDAEYISDSDYRDAAVVAADESEISDATADAAADAPANSLADMEAEAEYAGPEAKTLSYGLDDGLDAREPRTFEGYPCTVDCSGHEAGYEWAEEKGLDDPDDCGGNSNSFIEGCMAYAEEQ